MVTHEQSAPNEGHGAKEIEYNVPFEMIEEHAWKGCGKYAAHLDEHFVRKHCKRIENARVTDDPV